MASNILNFEKWSYKRILKERAKILVYSNSDKMWQKALIRQCEKDPIFAFYFFFWTYDPKQKPAADIPFILYPFQKDLISWIEDRIAKGEVGLVEKSRQMGVTWVMMTYIFWKWLFGKNFTTICGSRKEEVVDRRDKQDTLFYKLDYQIDKLPKWILPKGYNPLRHRRNLILTNPERNNIITGESSNPNFARGGTSNLVYFDEFASWKDAVSSWTAASLTGKTRIVVSTPAPGCYFKTLRFSNEMKTHNRVKTLHWTLHPSYDKEWYEKQKESMSEEALAQEVDLNYDVSGRGRVYEEFDLVPLGSYSYNPKLPLYTATDYGYGHNTAIIWAQKDENDNVYIIDTYQKNKETIDFFIPFYTGIVKQHNRKFYTPEELKQMLLHKRWKKARNFGDPAGKQRTSATIKSVVKVLGDAGIYVFTNDSARTFPPRRESTKMLMRRLFVDDKNIQFIEAIKQARYPERKITSQATSPVIRPIHDFTCLEGKTKIRTLKGWIPIKDLVGEKEIWVWSYSKDEKRLVPTSAHSAKQTGHNAPLLEIGLDNGNSIKVTPEHLFMLRDESWKQAQDLKVNDSLMPKGRVRFIKKAGVGNVYDLTVPKYHNFVAEGVITHNSDYRSALEYLAVNIKIGAAPKRVNYLKRKVKIDRETGKIEDEERTEEKKKGVIRYSFRSY